MVLLCCGRRTATKDDEIQPLQPGPRRSTLKSIRQSLGAIGPEDDEWKVGGRYKVQHAATLYSTAGLLDETGTLRPKDTVTLLSTEMKTCTEIGLVVPCAERRREGVGPGWIVLQASDSDKYVLQRRALEGSWEMRGRYRVINPATVRQDARLSSPQVGEVEPGQEVIVLDLGLEDGQDLSSEARLRAMISSSDSSLIGWISPETAAGDRLLEPVNLLGMEVVKLHRQSLAVASVGKSVRTGTLDVEGGPRKSCVPGAVVPWEVGGKYRVLEKLAVREKPELTSREIGKVAAGALATVADIHNAECAHLGWCPCAFIIVDDGPQDGLKGWVRCAAKDGRDLIDTRDQLESEKILHKLRASQMVPTAPLKKAGEDNPQAALPQTSWQGSRAGAVLKLQNWWRRRSSSSQDVRKAKEKQQEVAAAEEETSSGEEEAGGKEAVPNLLEQLESLETAREDRTVASSGALEGPEKSICNCNCGGPDMRRRGPR